MGNSSSSGRDRHDDTVDYGFLAPAGVYTGPRDWNQTVVIQLIADRKLAPFYRPLEDYESGWDDEQILAARKEFPQQEDGSPTEAESSYRQQHHPKRPSASKDTAQGPKYSEAAIYRDAVECPICFLYYPRNINHSRCCDQAICTECFVQIKRADPTPTHLVSEPAACPYCVQDNFGITYSPPIWRAGIGSEGLSLPHHPDSPRATHPHLPIPHPSSSGKRRKSFGADSQEVVTIDRIRPDWEQKLAAVRAAVARRANRRIIMRQVGDRLIPVGVTSGRVHVVGEGEETEQATGGSRRSRRARNQDINQILGQMGLGGQDLEELMVMEAMRLSLLEHEEQQRRQNASENTQHRNAADGSNAGGSTPARLPPIPVSTPLEVSRPINTAALHASGEGSHPTFSSSAPSLSSAPSGSLHPSSSVSHSRSTSSSPRPTGALATALGQAAMTARAIGTSEGSAPRSGSATPQVAPIDTDRSAASPSPVHRDSVLSTTSSAAGENRPYEVLPSPDDSIAEPLIRRSDKTPSQSPSR